MLDWFMAGGVLMWPVLAAGLLSVALAVDAGRRVVGPGREGAPDRRVRGRIGAVLFWGGFAALVGVLGTLGGVYQMARVYGSAGADASTTFVWDGIRVALIPSAFGLAILAVALLMWLGLSAARRRRGDAPAGPARGGAPSGAASPSGP